jgi:phosphate:Na+ symporter
MTFSLLLLQLAGAATLLIWAVRMVRTGVERGHAGLLRRVVRRAERGRFASSIAGAGAAVLLQGSTAVVLLASSFAQTGSITVATALAIVLGADVGSALVVLLLSFDLSWLMPILMLVGGLLFLRGKTRAVKQAGRIALGIALILLSLRLVGEATAPVHDSAILANLIGYLNSDPITALLLGAAITWMMHSSVAAILLFVTLAAQGLLPLTAGLGLILGGNVGSGLIAAGLTRGLEPEARRIAFGNLLLRVVAAVAGATLLLWMPNFLPLAAAEMSVATLLVGMHLAFNLFLLVTALPFVSGVARLLGWLIPEKNAANKRGASVSALDKSAVDQPVPALASATRELLRMGSMLEVMMRPVMALYENDAVESIDRIQSIESEINAAQTQTKLYLAEVSRNDLTDSESARVLALASFAINLEHAGDIITRTMLDLARKKRNNDLRFSAEGWRELTRLHDRVMANMQLSMNVLVSEDKELARQLVQEKGRIRLLEREGSEQHLDRLTSGAQRSIDTSNLHLETLRALRQINSAFASVAYPILSKSGDLLETRLAEV